jgi:hypothetical protein
MTVNELCARSGITRQWLNKRVDLGKVPGCHRKPNGRLEIVECKELSEWIGITADLQRKKLGKRLSLQERLVRVGDCLTPESYTAVELSRKVGLTASTINRRVLDIPGAYFDGTRYRFRNTPELTQWIKAGVAERYLEREKILRQRARFPSNEFLRAGGSINRAFVNMVRLMRYNPLDTWGSDQLRDFRNDLRRFSTFADSIDKEFSRRKEQSKLAASYSD